MALVSDGVQMIVTAVLAAWLLLSHFIHAGSVAGADLLLVFWTLKLPAIGGRIAGLAHQYPAQRNALLRLMEPLSAPEEPEASSAPQARPAASARAASIGIRAGSVVAAGHPILREVDLAITPGEHVAIVGVSGAGKSSLLGVLLGWHRLASGALTIDGHAADMQAIERLRRETAWVDPAIQVWNRSFLDNLNYAAVDDRYPRIGPVMQAAHLRGIVEKMPAGLQTLLGEGGSMLSGGEAQRVRLGRAMMMSDVRLALLDEPFRGLDREQRHLLLRDTRMWWKDTTLLCVTHDVAETLSFDRVLVIEDGRIVEDGAPSKLAANASRYSALLDAEEAVREQLWHDARWRRVRVQDGRVSEQAA
jgi:ATP-binding cassette subfamily B protein